MVRGIPEDRFDRTRASELSYTNPLFPPESSPWGTIGNIRGGEGDTNIPNQRPRIPRSSLLRVDTVTQEVSDHFPQVTQ